MIKNNKITNNNRTSPTPSPPVFRSPAQGYSKSILSAIKGIPYEPSSGNTSRSSANSSAVQSPTIIPGNINQNLEHGIRRAETTILKIKVGQFNEDEEKGATKEANVEENLTTTGNKSRRERRSISCETTLPTPKITPQIGKNDTAASSGSTQQKTQSVNMINLVAAGRPLPLIGSPLPGCSLASSQMGSTQSIQSSSTAPTLTNEGRIHRSPSAASSYCSKEEKSTTESHGAMMLPKIRITIFARALDACANGKLHELRELIGEYPELITYQYPHCLRLSCLHIAAKAGDIAIANYLLKLGANVNAKDDTWATPLHFAAKAGQVEMVRLLREKGADSSILDAHGRLYTAYLPTGQRKQMQSATLKPTKTSKPWDWGVEEDLSSLGSSGGNSQHSLSFAPSRFNHSFHSFRKPISRAVRDLLHRK